MIEPELSTPAEARAWAMAVALRERGLISAEDWERGLAGADDPEAAALVALERLAVKRGLTDPAALARRRDDWRRAAERTPHGRPVELGRQPALRP